MSSEAMKWARVQRLGTIGVKSLVNAIAARADKMGGTWASQTTLADDINASDRHVRAMLAALETLGVLTRTPRMAGRKGRLSDSIQLSLHRSFVLSSGDVNRAIREAKLPSASGTGVPVAKRHFESSNRNSTTSATGTPVPGNTKRASTDPSQGGKSSGSQDVALAKDPPRLVVVGGHSVAGGGGR